MAVNPNATYEPEDHKRESIELATPTKIGKVKIIDVLTSTAYKAGEALSAHMGYVLAQIGNASQYGRVKLSDNYTASAGAAADGVGASSAAVAAAYSALNSKMTTRFENDYFSTTDNIFTWAVSVPNGTIKFQVGNNIPTNAPSSVEGYYLVLRDHTYGPRTTILFVQYLGTSLYQAGLVDGSAHQAWAQIR